MIVQLTHEEVARAEAVGRLRSQQQRAWNNQGGLVDVARGGVAVDIQGATAELAVAKGLDRKWSGESFTGLTDWLCFRGCDVRGLEVRSTRRRNGCLILHDRDPDVPHALVIMLSSTTARIAGWALPGHVRTVANWRQNVPRPAYFVPQSQLHPIASLPVAP